MCGLSERSPTNLGQDGSTIVDFSTTRFDFTITQLDGTEGVRAILHFVTQVEKLRIASNHVAAASMPAFHNVICSLVLDTAKTAYERGMQKMQRALHTTAMKTAFDTHLAANKAGAVATATEKAAAKAHAAAIAVPAINEIAIKVALNEMITDLVPTGSLERVKRYMRRGCRKPSNMKIRMFIAHLTRINNTELPLLPPHTQANSLGDDEIIEIIMYAIPNSWNKKLREQGKDPVLMTREDFFKALENIESSETDFDKASSNNSPSAVCFLSL